MSLLTVLAALALVGLPLIRMEFPSVLGVIHASGAGERILVKMLVPLLLAAALVLPLQRPEICAGTLRPDLSAAPLPQLLAIAFSAAAAVLLASMLHTWVAVPYALTGAVSGSLFLVSGRMDWSAAGIVAGAWLLAPLLCGALTALLTRIFLRYTLRNQRHLAVMDHRMVAGCIFGSLLLAAAFGWNEWQLLSLFPGAVFEGKAAAGLTIGAVIVLYLVLARAIDVRILGMTETELDFGTGHTLAILLSMAATFVLFSWPSFLPAPLSAGSLLMAALTAGSLVRGRASVSGGDILRHAAATIVAPILGFLLGYCMTLILSGDPGRPGSAALAPLLVLLGIVAVGTALFLYRRSQRQEALHAQYLRSREEEAAATQKALSAMELRVETNEKDLMNKLEIKRKELTDFAMGVSGQKAFMEKVYEQLMQMRDLPDGPDKDRTLEEILTQLRERMYFNREMSDFYARMEVLHRDFNMRLRERHPDLTESERKLANLLRQGFSSKYIATLMNITPKSVEIGRYRLRTKLGLDRSVNLVQFIKSI